MGDDLDKIRKTLEKLETYCLFILCMETAWFINWVVGVFIQGVRLMTMYKP